ncbi:MAG: M28 family metallopeptidase [Pseudomonadota bacterium]
MLRVLAAAGSLALLAACANDAQEDATLAPAADEASSDGVALPLPLPKATEAAITQEDLAVRVDILADDAFEGRGPGSEVGELTADWIAQEMARIGLQPGGEDGSFFQTVGMVEQTIDEGTSGLTFSGGTSGREFPMTLGEDAVIWTKRQDITEASFDDSEMVFVGYGVVAPEYDWNDYEGLDAAGKTVVILVNDPGFATKNPELFKGDAMTYYGRWTYKFEEAARQGAKAAIIVHETAPASYGWDVVANSWSGAQADLVRANAGEDRALLEGWISTDTARKLFAEAGLDFEEMKYAAKQPGFSPVDMGGVTASGDITQTVTKGTSRNVIGVLPGQTAPDEYVLFTAHWDHLGKKSGEREGEPTQDFYRDDIFNGAVDNATGVSAILDIAEAVASEDHDRSVMFLAVTLEESGLLGSSYYVEYPTVPMNQIVAGFNIDAYQPVGLANDITVIGYGASELEDRLAEVIAEDDRVLAPDPSPQAGFFYRSDQAPFVKAGVPMLYVKQGYDQVDGGVAVGKAADQVHYSQRYHKPMDEVLPSFNYDGLAADAIAITKVATDIANSNDWPSWYEGNEFEAIREESLAELGMGGAGGGQD